MFGNLVHCVTNVKLILLYIFWLQATEEFSTFVCPALDDETGHSILRLSMGRMVDVLLANMESAVNGSSGVSSNTTGSVMGLSSGGGVAAASPAANNGGSSSPKMFLYSGHDSTIMPLLVGECKETCQLDG